MDTSPTGSNLSNYVPYSDGPADNTASDSPSSSDNSEKDDGSCPKSGGDQTDVPLSIFQAVFSLWFSGALAYQCPNRGHAKPRVAS